MNFGAGEKTDEIIGQTAVFGGTGADDDQTFWSTQAGIEKKFTTSARRRSTASTMTTRAAVTTGATSLPGDALNPTGAGNWAIWGTGVQVLRRGHRAGHR